MVTEKQNKDMLRKIEENKNKGIPITRIQKQIDKVFMDLISKGIACKQNFWCCQTCGSSAMSDYEDNPNFDGYCFYHNQDYDGLKKQGVTYLSYGSFRDNNMIDIGKKIVKAFRKEGIKVTWNGKAESRILIEF